MAAQPVWIRLTEVVRKQLYTALPTLPTVSVMAEQFWYMLSRKDFPPGHDSPFATFLSSANCFFSLSHTDFHAADLLFLWLSAARPSLVSPLCKQGQCVDLDMIGPALRQNCSFSSSKSMSWRETFNLNARSSCILKATNIFLTGCCGASSSLNGGQSNDATPLLLFVFSISCSLILLGPA